MEANPPNTTKPLWWASVLCVLMVLGLCLAAYQPGWGRWYFPDPYHRLQVEAFLHGQLALSPSIEAMAHDMAWYRGGVQQVWGLGTALWLLPFEGIARVFGTQSCPELFPLLTAMALLAWYASRTGILIARKGGSGITGLLFVYLVLLCPTLWTFVFGRNLIWEVTAMYAFLASLGLWVAVVRHLIYGRPGDFFVACLLASLTAVIRPTHGVYGMAALLICVAGVLRRPQETPPHRPARRRWGMALCGTAIVISGFAFLAITNWMRFGSVTEFGHRLHVSGDMIIYPTRFGNPCEEASWFSLARELFAWLFLLPFGGLGGKVGVGTAVPWTAPVPRWRDVYQPTFDPTYLLVLVVACVLGGVVVGQLLREWRSLRRGAASSEGGTHSPKRNDDTNKMGEGADDNWRSRLIAGLLVWLGFTTVPLGLFYLRFPTLSSRYILDFAPAFLAAPMILLVFPFRRWRPWVLGGLYIWMVAELAVPFLYPSSRWLRPQPLLAAGEVRGMLVVQGRQIPEFNGVYNLEAHPSLTGIWDNGMGWGQDGLARSIVLLMVDRPEYLELVLGETQSNTEPRPAAADVFRAKINNIELPIDSMQRTVEGTNAVVRIRFEVPEAIRRQNGDQLVSLCFTRSLESAALNAQRPLYEVRWRDSETAAPVDEPQDRR